MFARGVPFLATPSGYGDGTLALEKPDHRGHRMLRGNRNTHMPMVQHQMAFQNLAFFLPCQSMEDFPQLTTQLPKYCLASSLGDKHEVVGQSHFAWDRL